MSRRHDEARTDAQIAQEAAATEPPPGKKTKPAPDPLTTGERLHLASRMIRALGKLTPAVQKNVLTVVGDNVDLADALYALTSILRDLTAEDRAAVVKSAVALVVSGE